MSWARIKSLLLRDIALARAQGSGLGAGLGFMLAVMVLMPIALGPDLNMLRRLAPGLIWLALLLAVMLTADRIFHQDLEDGSLDAMTMVQTPFEVIVLTKSLAHWLTVSLPLSIIAPPLGLMMNLDVGSLPMLWAAAMIGSLTLSMLASLGGAITAGLRRGGLLIALLILPLYVPVLIFGVAASILQLGPQSSLMPLVVLAGFALLSVAGIPFACASVLRAYMR